jgi:hypothetical protein
MNLSTISDCARVRDVWNHFWRGEIIKRPPVVTQIPKPGCTPVWPGGMRYLHGLHGDYAAARNAIDHWLDTTIFLAESVPHYEPALGPDQYAAFFGGTLQVKDDSPGTSWSEPFVNDWSEVLPLRIQPDNPAWQSLLEFNRVIAEHGKGRYLTGVADLHSNMDALSSMRGPERLCMDFYDCPDLVARAMADVRATYPYVYESLYEAGGMSPATGTVGWIPFWCEGRFATIQCDFLCMISRELARQYVLPALEEEASYLDHCILHFDGPGALPHLDDILAIKEIDAIQWVPGAGQPPMHTWTDVLLRCQKAGKALQIYGVGPDEVKQLHRILAPNKTVYCVYVQSEAECNELLTWLERNT